MAPTDLTPNQQRILALVARGLSNRAIARELKVKPKTIENYLNDLYSALDLHDRQNYIPRVQAILYWLQFSAGHTHS